MGMETIGRPEMRQEGTDYVFSWEPTDIRVIVRDLYSGRDGPRGEISVVGLHTGHLHSAMLNLLSSTSKAGLTKALLARDNSLPWPQMVEDFCQMAVLRFREGDPLILLEPKPRNPDRRFAITPLCPLNVATLLFGDGKSGKSYLANALARALMLGDEGAGLRCEQSMAVAYLDWEWDQEEHEDRLHRVGAGGVFFYRASAVPRGPQGRTP